MGVCVSGWCALAIELSVGELPSCRVQVRLQVRRRVDLRTRVRVLASNSLTLRTSDDTGIPLIAKAAVPPLAAPPPLVILAPPQPVALAPSIADVGIHLFATTAANAKRWAGG